MLLSLPVVRKFLVFRTKDCDFRRGQFALSYRPRDKDNFQTSSRREAQSNKRVKFLNWTFSPRGICDKSSTSRRTPDVVKGNVIRRAMFQCARNVFEDAKQKAIERSSSFLAGTYDWPISQCSSPCGVGEIKRVQQGDACCWVCTPCDPVAYVEDEQTCRECPEGWWPTGDRRGCIRLEEQYMRWDSPFAVVPAALSAVGLVFTGIIVVAFVRHFDTPVVKASGRELSFMLFAGFAICYLMTFIILAKPGPLVCGAQRFGVGFGFAVTYSALVTKTNRISRIFRSARHSARRPPFISPRSQVGTRARARR
jgi:hypothetical protein